MTRDVRATKKEPVPQNKSALNPVQAAAMDHFMPTLVHRAAPCVGVSLHSNRPLP